MVTKYISLVKHLIAWNILDISWFLKGDISRHLIFAILENLFVPSHLIFFATFVYRVIKFSRFFSNLEKRE